MDIIEQEKCWFQKCTPNLGNITSGSILKSAFSDPLNCFLCLPFGEVGGTLSLVKWRRGGKRRNNEIM